MTRIDSVKLKFRVSSRDGSARKWTEKWGVTLAPNEEFHVTDQLLKLPFAEKKPQTLCVFSVPQGELRFRMVDPDRTATLNGVELRDEIVGLGDQIELAGMVTIEIAMGPERREPRPEPVGPSLTASVSGAGKTDVIDGPSIPNLTVETRTDTHLTGEPSATGTIPPIPRDEDGPTLTLSPVELKKEVDRKARAFSTPAAPVAPGHQRTPTKSIELDGPRRDEGINPDRIESDRPVVKTEEKAAKPAAEKPSLASRLSDILKRPKAVEPQPEESGKTLHGGDLYTPEQMPSPDEPGNVAAPVQPQSPAQPVVTRPAASVVARPAATVSAGRAGPAVSAVPAAAAEPAKRATAMPMEVADSLPTLEDDPTGEVMRPEARTAMPSQPVESAIPAQPMDAPLLDDDSLPAIPIEEAIDQQQREDATSASRRMRSAVSEEITNLEITPKQRGVAAAPIEPEGDFGDAHPDAEPWIPENEPVGGRLKRRAMVIGGAVAAALAIAGVGIFSWTKMNELNDPNATGAAPAATVNSGPPVRVEPLDRGIAVDELQRKIDDLRRSQRRL